MNIPRQYPPTSSLHAYPSHKTKNCLSRSPLSGRQTSLTPIKKLSEESILETNQKNYFESTIKRNNISYLPNGAQKPVTTANSLLKSQIIQEKYQTRLPLTPSKKITHNRKHESTREKKLSCLRNKIIHNLKDIRTIETKYDGSSQNKQVTEESAVIFKGSRDVACFCPVQLFAEGHEKLNGLAETKHSTTGFTPQKSPKKIHIIRKSDKNKYFVRELGSGGVYFFYHHLDSEFSMIPIEGENVMNVYSTLQTKINVIEPYEYTFNQLLSMGKMTQGTIAMIKNKIMALKVEMQKQAHREIQFAPMSEIVYYIHGKIKILPLVKKKYLLSHTFHLRKLRGRN